MRVDQRLECGRAQQRDVSVQQHHDPARSAQLRLCLHQCVPCAELRLLQCKAEAQPFVKHTLHLFGQMTDDDSGGGGIEGIGGAEDVLNEGQARRFVQHLRELGFHPRSLAGGKHNDVNI